MADVFLAWNSRKVVVGAIALPVLLYATCIAYLIVPVIVRAVVPSVVRSVTGT